MEEARPDQKDRMDGILPLDPEREGWIGGRGLWTGIAVTVAAVGLSYMAMDAIYHAIRAGRVSAERVALARSVADAKGRAELCQRAGTPKTDKHCARALKVSLFGSEDLADDVALCEKAPPDSPFCSGVMARLTAYRNDLALGQRSLEVQKGQ